MRTRLTESSPQLDMTTSTVGDRVTWLGKKAIS